MEDSMKPFPTLCAVLFCIAAGRLSAADPAGKWTTSVEGPQGAMRLEFEFHVKGDTLTGFNRSEFGEFPLEKGRMNGDRFSFDVSFGEMTMHHECVAAGDSIVMTVPGMQGEDMKMVLKRPAETK
jgi:hypothetical protein